MLTARRGQTLENYELYDVLAEMRGEAGGDGDIDFDQFFGWCAPSHATILPRVQSVDTCPTQPRCLARNVLAVTPVAKNCGGVFLMLCDLYPA